jgi:hypothetical protein
LSYSSDLVEQAIALCADSRRPKQANLRRAVSSAYYGLFHELTASAVAFMLPARRSDLQVPLRRKFAHKTMRDVARGGRSSRNKELAAVASAFVSLQEARHQADYDFSRSFTRFETSNHIERAADAVVRWASASTTPEGERFALELLVGKLDAA